MKVRDLAEVQEGMCERTSLGPDLSGYDIRGHTAGYAGIYDGAGT